MDSPVLSGLYSGKEVAQSAWREQNCRPGEVIGNIIGEHCSG